MKKLGEKENVDKVKIETNRQNSQNEEGNINKKKKIIILGTIIGIILVIYLGGSLYFKDKFHIGFLINNIDVSANTTLEAKDKIENSLKNYELTIEGKDKIEKINASDIDLNFNGEEKLNDILKSQNPFSWIINLFDPSAEILNNSITYDKNKLSNKIDKFVFFKKENVIEPKNASFKYEDGSFVIIEEEQGSKVDKKLLIKAIEEGIESGERTINLEEKGVYIKPKYGKDSEEVLRTKEELNNMLNTNLNYSFGGKNLTLDKNEINDWFSVDKDMNIDINKKKVANYAYKIALQYNTKGKIRSFKTSTGKIVNVSGGNYGYSVDQAEEVKKIISSIKKGENITREPVFSEKGNIYNGNDIGNSYVEISLGGQHIWFYKNGKLLVDSDIVTGDKSRGWATPAGVYKLTYKQKKAVLTGENYRTPVDFWMPFNGGIGLHDATWRSQFGGNIYISNGSHGCVNLPYKVAEIIFNNIDGSMPIVCY
ncbi:peptidoglycan binding domain-containing protein [uncultured Clostridium sp.]|uniref:L,D-transpeptidase family protein n=1 Tax=uncultured Clostridium sp. TaxID=59620 RepID=UPI002586DCA0|nr:peptidoglycan binding domain-containing protein [uncultured Clostridium sp.]